MTTNTYDSKEEKTFHERNPSLKFNCKGKQFPITFFDSDAQAFKACGDFYDETTKTVIEFKACQLNNHKTKAKSNKGRETDLAFGKGPHWNSLENGWNHSIYKQSLVQNGIESSNLEYSYFLVFKDKTKLSAQSKNKMDALGLNWGYESDWIESRVQVEPTIH